MRAPAPLVDLRLFRSAAFSAGSVGALVSYAMRYGIFFAMSFALIRGYHDAPFAAGLRLTVVPVALGLVALIAGALSERRPRIAMPAGMAICAVSAILLTRLLSGAPGSLPAVIAALATFGAGLGLYIAPNNSGTIGAAPPDAGGLLNLLRVFGAGLGGGSAAAALAWRLEAITGIRERTANVPEAALLVATGDGLMVLAALAAMAVIRDRKKADRKRIAAPGVA